MDPQIVNTAKRKDFTFDQFIPLIAAFEENTSSDVHVSGMPYIRTLNAQNIVDEIGLFVLELPSLLPSSSFYFLGRLEPLLFHSWLWQSG